MWAQAVLVHFGQCMYVLGTDSHSLALTVKKNFMTSAPAPSSNMQCSIRISFLFFLHFYELRSRMKHFNRIFMADECKPINYIWHSLRRFHISTFSIWLCVCARVRACVCVCGRSSHEQIAFSHNFIATEIAFHYHPLDGWMDGVHGPWHTCTYIFIVFAVRFRINANKFRSGKEKPFRLLLLSFPFPFCWP